MPNYVINKLHLSGEPSRINELLESIKGKEKAIEFNKILPMPESLNIESGSRTNEGLKAYKDFIDVYTMMGTEKRDLLNIPKEKEEIFLKNRPDIDRETWELGRTAFQNEQQYGAKDWYEWRLKHWDTKWDSCESQLTEDNTVEFKTAWSRVMPVIQRLAENFPDVKFEYCWADEDIGVNVGTAEFENGELVHDEFFEPQSKEAYEFAAEMWGYDDLEEMGLVFNEKSGTYEYQDMDESPQMS